ncbi:MAG: hypothetical protein Q4A41_05065 [Bacillota bacterium]|nr:hypothetical protein [Bacillota bacterium]
MKWNEFSTNYTSWTAEEQMANIQNLEDFGSNDEVFAVVTSLKEKSVGAMLMQVAGGKGVVFTSEQYAWLSDGVAVGQPHYSKEDMARMAAQSIMDSVIPPVYMGPSNAEEVDEFVKDEAIDLAENAAIDMASEVGGMGMFGRLLTSLGITRLFQGFRRKRNDEENQRK